MPNALMTKGEMQENCPVKTEGMHQYSSILRANIVLAASGKTFAIRVHSTAVIPPKCLEI